MAEGKNREIRLKRRPVGLPVSDDFELAETPIPSPAAGQALVRNVWMSVDPYMRGRMIDRKSYAQPYQIGAPLEGGALGRVVESTIADLKPGDWVESDLGWREWFVAGPEKLKRIEPRAGSPSAYLGALGMTGKTAYVGLLHVAELKPGDRVFISAAAGAVGSVACQIAKLKGCYVVGSAGSEEKCDYLVKDLGIDRAINYRQGDIAESVAAAFPEGIDVYFDNVGGSHLEAALQNIRFRGRIAICGMIDQYNAVEAPAGPRNLAVIIGRCVTMRGFVVPAYPEVEADFRRDMEEWTAAGLVRWRESIVEGIEKAPAAFLGLFSGENVGKMLVRLGPDEIQS